MFDRFSRDMVLGEVTVPLDDNRLLSTLIERRGVLETFQLNIERTPAPKSPLTKVSRVFYITLIVAIAWTTEIWPHHRTDRQFLNLKGVQHLCTASPMENI